MAVLWSTDLRREGQAVVLPVLAGSGALFLLMTPQDAEDELGERKVAPRLRGLGVPADANRFPDLDVSRRFENFDGDHVLCTRGPDPRDGVSGDRFDQHLAGVDHRPLEHGRELRIARREDAQFLRDVDRLIEREDRVGPLYPTVLKVVEATPVEE
ncbi:hypothetical protein [Cellulosimicrobium cellulans]|uniref:hypothetical protein n=1 Tax=Cellulosimicrobium cellulans TaxID=1710 RepID=UPI001883BBC7|nr:hypothetical protein [Cellulosimicrobium cellulans]MBE9937787.1 hypothetical protein [Cellulosimicrobium cellulans]